MEQLTDVIKEFEEKKNIYVTHQPVFIRIIAGEYKNSIFKISNISVPFLSVQTFDHTLHKKISLKYDEFVFLDGGGYTPERHFIKNTKTEKVTIYDALGNNVTIGDFVAFSDKMLQKNNNLSFGEITDISNTGKVTIKTIPTDSDKKSVNVRLKFKGNFIKLGKEQQDLLVYSRIKS